MTSELNVDTTNKVVVNGVDLVNRDEISPSQNRELQRFIDAHQHLLHFKDRELPPEPPSRETSVSNYSSLRKGLDTGNFSEYRRLDDGFSNGSANRGGGGGGAGYGGGNGTAGGYQYRNSSRSVSPEKKPPSGYNRGDSYSPWSSHTFPRSADDNYTQYGSLGGRSAQMSSPNADTLKRKGVSWSDLVGGQDNGSKTERGDDQTYSRHRDSKMSSQYGSVGNVSRDYNMSPAYSTLGKPRDNYNRFETESAAREREYRRQREEEERSKFSGYGDRPGSGVELTHHQWQGGEIITDPSRVPKSLKPRRFYYSPIGDGVVAADGVELKRKPVDLNPRVTVTQLTHVERGKAGKDGLSEYIKSWADGGSAPSSEYGGGLAGGPGSGRGLGAGSPDGNAGGPLGDGGAGAGKKGPGSGDPYGTLGSGYGGPDNGARGSPYGDGGRGDHGGPHGPPNDGRMSNASSMFSDPGYRYTDIKHGYAITNPRELIHQYATTTPVAVMDPTDNTPGTMTTATYKKKVTTRIEERQGGNVQGETFSPYPPYRSSTQTVAETRTLSPTNFTRKLRDDTMTHSQKEANAHQDVLNQRDPNANQRIHEIKQKTYTGRSNDEIDSLTNKLMEGLRNAPTPSRY